MPVRVSKRWFGKFRKIWEGLGMFCAKNRQLAYEQNNTLMFRFRFETEKTYARKTLLNAPAVGDTEVDKQKDSHGPHPQLISCRC